jgi:hypothetical protein
MQKEVLRYKRSDGVDLTGTLYLPPGYDAARDGPLPTILWAYPREYKSKVSSHILQPNRRSTDSSSGSSNAENEHRCRMLCLQRFWVLIAQRSAVRITPSVCCVPQNYSIE